MAPPTSLSDPAVLLVADSSAVINLTASARAQEIVRAIPNHLVVVDAVPNELESGRNRGRQSADVLNALIASGLMEIVRLGDAAEQHFEQLVIGPAAMTLDDGEAATIAYAVAHGAVAIIDERKAKRICEKRFPALSLRCTVDIFAHPNVGRSLGARALADTVFAALCEGRMRVFPRHVDWVVTLIGQERAGLCTSLPSSVRSPR